jgi:hypothetical protein
LKFIDDFGCGYCRSISYVWVAKELGDARTSVGIHIEAVHNDLEGSFVSLSIFIRNLAKAFPWDNAVISVKMRHVPCCASAPLLVERRSLEQDDKHVHCDAENVIFLRGIGLPCLALGRLVVGCPNVCISARNIGLS